MRTQPIAKYYGAYKTSEKSVRKGFIEVIKLIEGLER